MTSRARSVISIISAGILSVVAVFSYIIAFLLLKDTIVSLWIPLSISLFVALISGLTLQRIWHFITGSGSFAANYLYHIFFVSGILFCAMLLANRLYAEPGSIKITQAEVTRIYNETHYQSKRVSRRVYTRGAPYKVYMADLKLNNGKKYSLKITKAKYDVLEKGDTLGLPLLEGALGWPIVDTNNVIYPQKSKNKHEKRRRKPQFNPDN